MCMACEWGDLFPGDDTEPDAAAAERQRASQESWARLMEEIARADAASETARAGGDGGGLEGRPLSQGI